MSVGKFCNREVVITDRQCSLLEVAKLMRQYHVGDVVVAESRGGQNFPVGIITDRDLVVDLIAKEIPLEFLVAGDMTSPNLVTVREGDGIWETLVIMRNKGVRRVPVVNDVGGLEGILTVDDLLELLAEELAALAKVPGREVQHEKVARP